MKSPPKATHIAAHATFTSLEIISQGHKLQFWHPTIHLLTILKGMQFKLTKNVLIFKKNTCPI